MPSCRCEAGRPAGLPENRQRGRLGTLSSARGHLEAGMVQLGQGRQESSGPSACGQSVKGSQQLRFEGMCTFCTLCQATSRQFSEAGGGVLHRAACVVLISGLGGRGCREGQEVGLSDTVSHPHPFGFYLCCYKDAFKNERLIMWLEFLDVQTFIKERVKATQGQGPCLFRPTFRRVCR